MIRGSLAVRVWATLSTAAMILVFSSLGVGRASATDYPHSCPHGGNSASISCLNPNNGQAYSGAYGSWHNNRTIVSGSNSSNLYHVNEEMWGYVNGHETTGNWIEGGLRNGYLPEDPCKCVAYAVFWAKFINGAETRYFVANKSPDGTNHVYQFLQAGCGCAQDFFYDFNYIGAGTGMVGGNIYDHQIGLEVADAPFSQAEADTFDMFPQATPSGGSSGAWTSHYSWVDSPCGTYVPPNCLNGSAPQTSEWVNSKSN